MMKSRGLRFVVPAAVGFLLTSLAGCEKPGETTNPPPDVDMGVMTMPTSPGDGHVADAVIATLNNLASGKKGKSWNVSGENLLDGDWLIQSPPEAHFGKGYANLDVPTACSGAGCATDFALLRCQSQTDCVSGGRCVEVAATVTAPAQSPQKLCVGHSDHVYDEMYRVMVSAQKQVDVASLLPPDGRFKSAMRNAVTFLGNSGRAVTVRFIFGTYPGAGAVDSKVVLQDLTRDLPPSSAAQVFVGAYRSSNLPPSWNHSKIVAADGKRAIVGGHNLWDAHYLIKNPAHDISMRLSGPAAADAHNFASEQWYYTCSTMNAGYCFTGSVCAHAWKTGAVSNTCPPVDIKAQLSPETPGDVRTVAMGRLAWVDTSNMSNQSDTAFLTMAGAARTSIRMSQQDLGPLKISGVAVGSWPDALWAQLAAALVRGVDVYIVLSNKDSVAGGLSGSEAAYSNGWTLEEVGLNFRAYFEANPPPGAPTGPALRDLICRKFHLAPLRFSSEETFPDGVPYGNHAKFFMVDDQAFYIGSQNQYDAGLTEFGFMTDDARAAFTVSSSYWNPLWRESSRRAVSGSEASACALR
jgi:phosphatidylserine/phosphatidylglycerophosphate/cardiolipin synthase-like enzyme